MWRELVCLGAFALVGCSGGASPSEAASSAPASASAVAGSSSGSAAASAAVPVPSASSSASADASAAPPVGTATAVTSAGRVIVPEGIFKMGGTGEDDSPIHEVAVARFELDATEVTMDAYAACVAAKKCEPPKADNPFCNVKLEGRGKHPVNCVDYRDAEAYCAFVGERLPTEREWEYAARGGAEQHTFSWGEELPDTTRACYMHQGGSCEVASFAPGAFGLYDMSGNVWEWTSSWFAKYPDEPATGQFKVYRGGSWSRRFPKWLHNELRNRYRVDEHSASLGIRCAKTSMPVTCPAGSTSEAESCILPKDRPTEAACGTGKPGVPPCPTLAARTVASASAPGAASETPPNTNDQPPVKTRSAEFDADCGHYPGFPVSYTWRGGSYQAREPIVASSGCKKRDIGVGWTSTCCPQ